MRATNSGLVLLIAFSTLLGVSACASSDEAVRGGSQIVDNLVPKGDNLAPKADNLAPGADNAPGQRVNRRTQAKDLATQPYVAQEVDAAVRSQLAVVSQESSYIVDQAVIANAPDQSFIDDFERVTQDAIIGVGCGYLLDEYAPERKPSPPGVDANWEQPVNEAIIRLNARWGGQSFRQAVDWTLYAISVGEAAQRFDNALTGNPQQYAYLANEPINTRALVVYLRTCYSPPR